MSLGLGSLVLQKSSLLAEAPDRDIAGFDRNFAAYAGGDRSSLSNSGGAVRVLCTHEESVF